MDTGKKCDTSEYIKEWLVQFQASYCIISTYIKMNILHLNKFTIIQMGEIFYSQISINFPARFACLKIIFQPQRQKGQY